MNGSHHPEPDYSGIVDSGVVVPADLAQAFDEWDFDISTYGQPSMRARPPYTQAFLDASRAGDVDAAHRVLTRAVAYHIWRREVIGRDSLDHPPARENHSDLRARILDRLIAIDLAEIEVECLTLPILEARARVEQHFHFWNVVDDSPAPATA